MIQPYLDWLRINESALNINNRGSCADYVDWPYDRRVIAAWVLLALIWTLYASQARSWTITSVYRCPAENVARGGVARSRHQFGAGPGQPYGAIDYVPDPASLARMRQIAQQLPGYIRQATGWPYGVGVIVYRAGHVHIDLRERPDWVDVQ